MSDRDEFGIWQDERQPLNRAGIALCCLSGCLVLVAVIKAVALVKAWGWLA